MLRDTNTELDCHDISTGFYYCLCNHFIIEPVLHFCCLNTVNLELVRTNK